MKVKRHIPAFVERDPEPDDLTEVSTLDDLLRVRWVKDWSDEPYFDHWERSDYSAQTQLLMAIHKDGTHWVTAYVTTDGDLSALPQWKYR